MKGEKKPSSLALILRGIYGATLWAVMKAGWASITPLQSHSTEVKKIMFLVFIQAF